jgi:hypothetical protein
VAWIVAASCLTGIAYYRVVYGDIGNISIYVQVGVLAGSIFAISNMFRANIGCPASPRSSCMAGVLSNSGTSR